MRISIAPIVLIGLLLGPFAVLPENTAAHSPTSRPKTAKLSSDDEALLEDLERRGFLYFWEQQDPRTGLVRDRARTDGSLTDETHLNVASIAATGFGLTALCIAAQRQWMDPEAVRARVRSTLQFFATRATEVHGWFYHWRTATTGERVWQSEVSSIDTALLLGGILATRGYYGTG